MKNAVLLIFFFGCLVYYSSAQVNLVPNSSFEDTLICPDDLDQVSRSIGWFVADGTPDYYNSCFTTPIGIWNVDVPSNSFGYQYAMTGNAYIGLATYIMSGGGTSIREAIGIELVSPLQIGEKYFISFYVTLHNALQNSCAANKLGIYFSTQAYNWSASNPIPRMNQSQFYSDSIITDTLNWVRISGSFVSDSNYTFCYIGNFFDDSLTNYTIVHGNGGTAYYFLDDICISTDSVSCIASTPVIETDFQRELEVFPKVFDDYFYLDLKNSRSVNFALFDAIGKKVKITTTNDENRIKIFPSQISTGIYLLQVFIDKKSYTFKLVHNN